MKLIDPNELFSSLEQLDPAIKDKGKIPDIDATYTEFIHRYDGVSITPDIVLYGYQKVLEWNRRARGDGLPEDLLLIGQSGQGDEWFLSARRKTVFFFDHDQGEYGGPESFLDLEIDFTGFLRMAFLLSELEQKLDEGQEIDEHEQEVSDLLNSIHPQLRERFPFNYFE